MLRIVEGYQDPKENPLFHQMFLQRAKIFKHKLGWDIALDENGYDIDPFDDENTVYLIDVDENENMLGSIRLRPTVLPHLLTGAFSDIFPDILVRSPIIFEASRFVASDNSHTIEAPSLSASRLMLGMCELGIKTGYRQILGIVETSMLRFYKRSGLIPEVLGKTRTEHCAITVGLWDTNEEVLKNMQIKLGIFESVLSGPKIRLEEAA